MSYPEAVVEKAKQVAHLLQRVEAGQALAEVCTEMGLAVTARQLVKLEQKYEAGERSWTALVDGRYGHPIKANSAIREWLYTRRREDGNVRAPQLAGEVAAKFGVSLTPEHINYLLRKRGLTAPVGRPFKKEAAEAEAGTTSEQEAATQANAGLFFPGSSQDGAGGGASH